MTFILVPDKGEDGQVNAWNWRPILELLRAEKIITDRDYELLGLNGCGSRVDSDLARRIGDAIENKLSTMRPGDRIRADLTVTNRPRVPQVFAPHGNPDDIDAASVMLASCAELDPPC